MQKKPQGQGGGQHKLIELSVLMEVFCIYALQYGRH